MSDLKSKKWIYFKAVLFLLIIVMCAGMLIYQSQNWQTVVLVGLLIWASARLYYFMFYVIGNYVDPEYKFSSVYAFLLYLFKKRK